MRDGNRDYQIERSRRIFNDTVRSFDINSPRVCSVCGETKKNGDFYYGVYKTSQGHDNFRIRKECKICIKKNIRDRYFANVNHYKESNRIAYREKRRFRGIKNQYGLDRDSYLKMVEDAKTCPICYMPITKPVVDHCHTSGIVRGILCWHCNVGIGHFRDDINTLYRAIKYIEKHSTGSVSKPGTPING